MLDLTVGVVHTPCATCVTTCGICCGNAGGMSSMLLLSRMTLVSACALVGACGSVTPNNQRGGAGGGGGGGGGLGANVVDATSMDASSLPSGVYAIPMATPTSADQGFFYTPSLTASGQSFLLDLDTGSTDTGIAWSRYIPQN